MKAFLKCALHRSLSKIVVIQFFLNIGCRNVSKQTRVSSDKQFNLYLFSVGMYFQIYICWSNLEVGDAGRNRKTQKITDTDKSRQTERSQKKEADAERNKCRKKQKVSSRHGKPPCLNVNSRMVFPQTDTVSGRHKLAQAADASPWQPQPSLSALTHSDRGTGSGVVALKAFV